MMTIFCIQSGHPCFIHRTNLWPYNSSEVYCLIMHDIVRLMSIYQGSLLPHLPIVPAAELNRFDTDCALPGSILLFRFHPIYIRFFIIRVLISFCSSLIAKESIYTQEIGCIKARMPIPAAARSKAWVYCRSLAGIAVSNPARGMDVSLVSVVCCRVEVSASG